MRVLSYIKPRDYIRGAEYWQRFCAAGVPAGSDCWRKHTDHLGADNAANQSPSVVATFSN